MCYVVVHNQLNKGDKISKTVFICNSKEQAENVINNVAQTICRKYIKYRPTRPNYNLIRYDVQFIDANKFISA